MTHTSDSHTLTLARPLERTLRDGHPWIYQDALRASAPAGSIVTILDARGQFVARGISDGGVIGARVFTLRDETLGESLFRARIDEALSLRARVIPADTNAYRLIHGEGDRLPGFVVDRYGDVAVLKTDGAGASAWADRFGAVLIEALAPLQITTLLRRSSNSNDQPNARKVQLMHGTLSEPRRTVLEHGMKLLVDLEEGQKTGLFLDQRESRALVRTLARDARVLNLYGYTGGFSVAAGLGGARLVDTVDIAPAAIALANDTWALNGLDPEKHRGIVADVAKHTEVLNRNRARYDLVIADPPNFAPSERALEQALTAYRALHSACLPMVISGGYYLAGSCSSHVHREAFEETVRESARKSRRQLQLIHVGGAPADHPRIPVFTEGHYLKADLYRVLS
ncbi:MAG: class I SAM-dependent rRNA methyltransferase [Deltaproteobacteria bacterium]|nr:class I SAM-dependent rRNA methyltransferase [Deltaproteobacteria bacterium]